MPNDERDRNESPNVPATFTGESTGSGPNTPTNIGRDGDAIIQDDVVYGRATSDRDHAERERKRVEEHIEEARGDTNEAGNED